MKIKTISLILIGSTLMSVSLAQPPPPQSPSVAPDAAELTQLLKDFLDGASRNNLTTHERFWAEDLIYTSALGRRRTKDDIRHDLTKENSSPTGKEQAKYSGEDIRIHQYGTAAIVAFELVATTTKDGKTETTRYLNTGTFLKRDGKWQAVAWQATKKGEEQPK